MTTKKDEQKKVYPDTVKIKRVSVRPTMFNDKLYHKAVIVEPPADLDDGNKARWIVASKFDVKGKQVVTTHNLQAFLQSRLVV